MNFFPFFLIRSPAIKNQFGLQWLKKVQKHKRADLLWKKNSFGQKMERPVLFGKNARNVQFFTKRTCLAFGFLKERTGFGAKMLERFEGKCN